MKKKGVNSCTPPLTTETRRLKDLVPFPLQADTYLPLPDKEEKAFRASIAKHGIQECITILGPNQVELPPETMIDGHRRVAVGIDKGINAAPVRVRHDLRHADWKAVVEAFINANKDRRQLCTLAKFRCHVQRSLQGKALADLDKSERLELKKHLSKAMTMSKKNVERYLRLLTCPKEVQQAVEHELVGLVLAEKVADLPTELQRKIARRIGKGHDPKKVIQIYVAASARPQSRGTTVGRCITLLKKAIAILGGHHLTNYGGTLSSDERRLIVKTKKIARQLLVADDRERERIARVYEVHGQSGA